MLHGWVGRTSKAGLHAHILQVHLMPVGWVGRNSTVWKDRAAVPIAHVKTQNMKKQLCFQITYSSPVSDHHTQLFL